MLLYRIASAAYSFDLTGDGAAKYGGRWSPKGKPVLYTAENPALAMLECLAHFAITGAPSQLVLVTIRIPDTITIRKPTPEEYPKDWKSRPTRPASVRFGSDWLEAAEASVLRVPSVVTPEGYGWNFLLNPMHPELANAMAIENSVEWTLDVRIAGSLP